MSHDLPRKLAQENRSILLNHHLTPAQNCTRIRLEISDAQSHPGPQWRVLARNRKYTVAARGGFSFYGPRHRGVLQQRTSSRRRIMANPKKNEYLDKTIEHFDITKHNVVPLVDSM